MGCMFDFLERCPELSAMMQGMPSREMIAQQCDSAQQMGKSHLWSDFDFIVIETKVLLPSFNAVTGVEPDCVRASFCS